MSDLPSRNGFYAKNLRQDQLRKVW